MDENGINQMLQQATEHHRAGRLRDAELIYRQILSQNPDHPHTLYLMGALADQCGQVPLAEDLLTRATTLKSDDPNYQNAVGLVMLKLGQPDRAITAFGAAARLAPNVADFHNHLGSALAQRRLLEQAMEAIEIAVQLNPKSAEFHYNLGTVLGQMGMLERATDEYQKAIDLKPDFANAHNNLGIALQYQGKIDQAMEAYQTAFRLNPRLSTALGNMGTIAKERGLPDQAAEFYRRAIELNPADITAHDNLVYLQPFQPGCSPEEIRWELQAWNQRHGLPLKSRIRPHVQDRNPDRRLRIGYVSPNFREHVVGRNVLPLLENRNRGEFEITCYSNTPHGDQITERFRALADRWHDVRSWTDAHLAEQVRRDGIDILVDLALHMEGNRLLAFAEKPAPVQVTFAGYPGSTGMDTIDYRLTDPYLDPPGQTDACYSEQSIRLPETFWCYQSMGDEPQINASPFQQSGQITFGCLNNFSKINDHVLELWSTVLRAADGSRLLILSEQGAHRQRTLDILGLPPGVVEFLDKKPRRQYMEHYHRIDIALDTIPYNAHTTSLDAAFMGVPTVTLIGPTVVGRAGWSQLSNLGLTELAAETQEQFVDIATTLAKDRARLAELRATLRQRMQRSPLMDARRFTSNIEAAFRAVWKIWCTG